MLFVPFFRLSSVIVVPERYAKNAGIIGSMHGDTKEPNPASAATARVTSVMMSSNNFYFKGFFQIFSLFATIPFYLSPNYLEYEQTICDCWYCSRYNDHYCILCWLTNVWRHGYAKMITKF